jgi:hypothetical protein
MIMAKLELILSISSIRLVMMFLSFSMFSVYTLAMMSLTPRGSLLLGSRLFLQARQCVVLLSDFSIQKDKIHRQCFFSFEGGGWLQRFMCSCYRETQKTVSVDSNLFIQPIKNSVHLLAATAFSLFIIRVWKFVVTFFTSGRTA